MQRALASLVLLLALVGCDGGNPDVFADMRYAVRCNETRGCPGESQRDICGFNMGDPCVELGDVPSFQITCDVEETSDNRTITFVALGLGFSLRITSLVVPFAGGPGGGPNCRVRVQEGANLYEGACGSSAPSEAQPCQIPNVSFRDDMGNPTLEGSVRCEYLPNTAMPANHVELSTNGSGPMAQMTPAGFRLANCAGLHVEAP
ncbi:MAG: hypothetical protein AB7S26_25960 [Sandaracinaceae bacterium]